MADLGPVPIHGQSTQEPVHTLLGYRLCRDEQCADAAIRAAVAVLVELCATSWFLQDDAEVLVALVAASSFDQHLDRCGCAAMFEDQLTIQLLEIPARKGPAALGLVLAGDPPRAAVLALHNDSRRLVEDFLRNANEIFLELQDAWHVVVDDDHRRLGVVPEFHLVLGSRGAREHRLGQLDVELLVLLVRDVVDDGDFNDLAGFTRAKHQGIFLVFVVVHRLCLPLHCLVLDCASCLQVAAMTHHRHLDRARVLEHREFIPLKLDDCQELCLVNLPLLYVLLGHHLLDVVEAVHP
mmetsp:Transcript_50632/g.151394  ORF Transcript_50632/g.151394 Transcript_50632/m.151394 type:complete len:295 (+) Transcript_50632:897-1781(+)